MSEKSHEIQKENAKKAGRPNEWKTMMGPVTEMADKPEELYPEARLADKACEKLEQLKDTPFFIGVGFVRPHLAFAAPKKYWDLYDRDKLSLSENSHPIESETPHTIPPWRELRTYNGAPPMNEDMPPVDDELAKELIHGYYACVSFIDAQIGKLLDKLDELKLREKTIIVLWGDHGWHLGDHNYWGKMTNLDVSTRSPLIISSPSQKTVGGKTEALTEFVDIYPTLCDLCGLDTPKHVEGVSLKPLLDNPERSLKTAVFSQYARWPFPYSADVPLPADGVMGRSIRDKDCRYVEWTREGDGRIVARELYIYRNDPDENVNVADEPQNKQIVEKMHELLKAGWRAAVINDDK